MGKAINTQTVPQGFQGLGTLEAEAPRRTLRAGPQAVRVWAEMVAQAERDFAAQAAEDARRERHEGAAHLARVEVAARARGEEAERSAAGPLVLARDGLEWLTRKGVLLPVHRDAGLRFRSDYELAHGTGVLSSLADPGRSGGGFRSGSGPSDAMMKARARVDYALATLGTPLLVPYVLRIAGEGVMLSDPQLTKDPRRVAEHNLPCRIAFDMLARTYGMIR